MNAAPLSTTTIHLDKSVPIETATDAELLMRFTRRRDKSAFAELVEKHSIMVARVCQQVLGGGQDADDAFQATFLILAQRSASIRRASSVAAWLHGVAYRTAIRTARGKKTRKTVPVGDPISDEASVFSLIHRREMQQILHEELRAIPAKYRDVLTLHYLEGMSRGRIASELECTEATVKGNLARGRKQMRLRLARRGVGLSIAAAAVVTTTKLTAAQLDQVTTIVLQELNGFNSTTGSEDAAEVSSHVLQLAKEGVREMLLSTVSKSAIAVCAATALVAAVALNPSQRHVNAQEPGTGGAAIELSLAVEEEAKTSGPAESNVDFAPATTANAGEAIVELQLANSQQVEDREPPPTPASSIQFDLQQIESELMMVEAESKRSRADALRMKAEAMEAEANAMAQSGEQQRQKLLSQAQAMRAGAEAYLLQAEAKMEESQAELLMRKAVLMRKAAKTQRDNPDLDLSSAPSQYLDVTTGTEVSAPRKKVIAPTESLMIRVVGEFPDDPIDGVFVVEPSGMVALGPGYGRAHVTGLTLEEAEKAIQERLSETLVDPMVQVTWPGYETREPDAKDLLRQIEQLKREVERLSGRLSR